MTTQPQTNGTGAATPPPVSDRNFADEFAYLEAHGGSAEAAELKQELESLLGRGTPPVAPQPVPVSGEPDFRLPIARDGSEVKLDPLAAPQPLPQPQPSPAPVTQEQALDPLSPEAPKSKLEDAADADVDGGIVIDTDGKIRDAKTGRFVPHGALHAEREARKAALAEAAKLREDNARVQERLNVLTEIIHGQQQLQREQAQPQPQQPEPDIEIDPEKDIFAAVKALKERDEKRAQRLAEVEQHSAAQIKAMQEEARYRQESLSYAMRQKDYPQAYKHFNESRRNELKLLGFQDAVIEQQIMAEERILMSQGLKMKDGPAHLIYQIALSRGYQPPKPRADPEPAPAPQPSPAPLAPAAAAAPLPAPQIDPAAMQAVQRVQNGQIAAASLTGAGGVGEGHLTVQSLADMSEEDFLSFASKVGARKLDKLLGWKG